MKKDKNCWWDGHGAEEVDSPKGTAVATANTVEACKAACLSAPNYACEGVLWKAAGGECYRKRNIDPRRCSADPNFVLFLRTDANRPPSAPKMDASYTSEKCTAMMRDPSHKFYGIWDMGGWGWRNHGEAACWGDGNWFNWVAGGNHCDQSWGNNLNAPTVFGFSESMAAYCDSHGGGNQGDPGAACGAAK